MAVKPLFGHVKILLTLEGMGSAALVAAVALPGYGDTYVLKNKQCIILTI